MPDLGNPNILGGLCWWNECLPLILEAGWKAPVEHQSSSKMGFGDGPASVAVCIAKQAPLRILLQDSSAILFFADVRIVPNNVVLLFGKTDMKALRMKCELVDNIFRFANRKCPGQVLEASHYHILLDFPKKKGSVESVSKLPSPYTTFGDCGALSCQRRSLRSFAASVDLESIPQLHSKLGCPSATDLKCFIRDAQQHALTVDQIAEIDRLVCSLCSHHGPAPARPIVAQPNYRQPGLCVHIDMGSVSFPRTKSQLKAAVMVDAFSMLIMGDLHPLVGERQGKTTGKERCKHAPQTRWTRLTSTFNVPKEFIRQ